MKLLIIIPAYNEALNIERVVDSLVKNYSQYDYIVINDGSRDNTATICKERGYNLVDLPVNCGLSGAVCAGMRYAIAKGYDAVIQFDGDGQHRPEYIEPMMDILTKQQADIVIGSRFLHERRPWTLRMLGSRMISGIIQITTGVRIMDPTSGMRMYGKKMLHEFAYDMNYGPEPDTISYLLHRGIKIKEVQVTMDERIAGESYLNFVRSIKYMLLQCFSILFIQSFRRKE